MPSIQKSTSKFILTEGGGYGILTLHRPENVDDTDVLRLLMATMLEVAAHIPLIFPIHPRTKAKFQDLGFFGTERLRLVDPVGYIDMVSLVKNATCVLTDSGGLQEETTALGVPCITLRNETERPVTVTVGTSEIVGRDRVQIVSAVERVLRGEWKRGRIPDLWDGRASERIADILLHL